MADPEGKERSTNDSALFSKEQVEWLQKMFSQGSSTNPVISTGSAAQRGNFLTALHTKTEDSSGWIIDSGASDHMTGDISVLHDCSPCHENYKDLASGMMIGNAKESKGLYWFRAAGKQDSQAHHISFSTPDLRLNLSLDSNKESTIMLLHYRLGHPNFMYLSKMFPALFKNKNPKLFQCEICQFSKHCRNTYPSQNYKPSKPFSIIHSDIWGPSPVHNISGARWFVSLFDDHTRVTWVFLMKEKSEVGSIFKFFHSMIQTQFQAKIQVFRTDNAREYFNVILGNYLLENGIIHQSS